MPTRKRERSHRKFSNKKKCGKIASNDEDVGCTYIYLTKNHSLSLLFFWPFSSLCTAFPCALCPESMVVRGCARGARCEFHCVCMSVSLWMRLPVVYVHFVFSLVEPYNKTNKPPICTTTFRMDDNDSYDDDDDDDEKPRLSNSGWMRWCAGARTKRFRAIYWVLFHTVFGMCADGREPVCRVFKRCRIFRLHIFVVFWWFWWMCMRALFRLFHFHFRK